MLFGIAYFGLFLVGLIELRHAVREGDGKKARLMLAVVLCHLLLAFGYVRKVELAWPALSIVGEQPGMDDVER